MSATFQKAVFLLPIGAVGLAAAIHATAYLTGEERRHFPRFWLFFLLTIAAMAGVVLSSSLFGFLLAWETMGLASAGLVAFENEARPAKKATWIYLMACHAGACALMLAGVLLARGELAVAALTLGFVGFGLKIGFPPFHVWLPEAHPAAPAPASAVMSGAMIPLGFYGLTHFFGYSGGWAYLALGIVGALGGILFALPQTNLKKLLAFSSVENMGVISMGLGLYSLTQDPAALAGALAHVLNHAFLKGALFLGAGSVLRQTGTLNQDALGGLMKRMPFTGSLFTVNALGLAGLPPLNGFLGELLIYLSALHAVTTRTPSAMVAGFAVLVALSLTGGLAAAAYCKAIGASFLGEPRGASAAQAVETPRRMYLAQAFLTLGSLAMIPGTVLIANHVGAASAVPTLIKAAVVGCGVVLLTAALLVLRRKACPRGGVKPVCPTWDCGYHAPTARMAYTATAFTQPLADLFRGLLRSRRHLIPFRGHPSAPFAAGIATETDDLGLAGFWRPVFTWFARLFQRAHLLQNGSLHLYILLILLAVAALVAAAFFA